ncbi:MAG: hypothetical protein ACK56F_04495 [bacterium]
MLNTVCEGTCTGVRTECYPVLSARSKTSYIQTFEVTCTSACVFTCYQVVVTGCISAVKSNDVVHNCA